MKPKYIIGKIKDNEVKINQLQRKIFASELAGAENKEVLIEIANPDKIRSQAQNAYYWVLINELTKHTGQEDWKWHSFFKYTFLHDKIKSMKIEGGELAVLPTTSDLGLTAFAKYLDNIIHWIRERIPEFIIPDPKDYYEFYESRIKKNR